MLTTQREENDLIKLLGVKPLSFNEAVLYNKMSDMEDRLQKVESILENDDFLGVWEAKKNLSLNIEKKRNQEKIVLQTVDNWHECRKIVERSLEILSYWEEANDIRMQIQYAAILVGKIAILKKKEEIFSDEVRKEVCTLLKMVIRLNVSEEIFSKEQIDLLRQGFSIVIGENIQKSDLFELNRKMLKKKLVTMPAWE